MDPTHAPRGCGASVSPIHYNLCDLDAVWGVVVEAVATAGMVTSFVLLVILIASLPFVTNKWRKSMVALQATFLVFALGLFGLAFAFVVKRDFTTCAARRFLFGVLFAGCLACLAMHGLGLTLLGRGSKGPRGWTLCLGALALWLVEVIINTEWLIITVVRTPVVATAAPDPSCVTNQDFVMALIYVKVLLLATLLLAVLSLTRKRRPRRRDGIFILATGVFTAAIWAAWIAMYVHGNQATENDSKWDDPTLAIALVCNAWVFLVLYVIPEICLLTEEDRDQEEPDDADHVYPESLVYDNILVDQNLAPQNMYMENKAFSVEEPSAERKPVSPYNGQLRSSVYQPTELALITKGLPHRNIGREILLPRATAPPFIEDRRNSLPRTPRPLPPPLPSSVVSGNILNRGPFR